MTTDNSVYTVTYPDLHILRGWDGNSITDRDFIDKVKAIFEKYIHTSIVFYVQSKRQTVKPCMDVECKQYM